MSKFSFKDGVEIGEVSSKLINIWQAVANLSARYGYDTVVTSVRDGTHMEGSKHYTGEASDFRIWWFDEEELKGFAKELQSILGKHYDVVIENTHLHVEYDKKQVE